MTEKYLIDFLSAESEKMDFECFDLKNRFDTDICGWKDILPETLTHQSNEIDPPRFRIRNVARKGSLSRCSSNLSHQSTISSGNSENASPLRDAECGQRKNNVGKIPTKSSEVSFPNAHYVNIKIHEPAKARKMRKPIKVFKLPNVSQENNE